VTASTVLAVALDLRRALEKLSPREREEAILLLLDDEPVEPEDITRAQVAELDPDVEAAFPTTLPVAELAPQPEGARPWKPAGRHDLAQVAEARVREVVQLVANAGGKAQTSWIQEKLGLSQTVTSKHIRRALAAKYLVSPKTGVVELNPDPSAPVVVADRSGERAKKAVRR